MASTITVLCLVLFVAYSVALFVGPQSHVVALANFVGNECDTSVAYDTPSRVWISAILGTLLCVIPALLLLYSMHFPIRMKAVALLPSYVVLGLLTGIAPSSVEATTIHFPIASTLVLLVVSIVAIFGSQIYHEDRGEHAPLADYLWSNVLLSCLGIGFCLVITNTDPQLHLQQPLAQTLHRGDYAFANSIHYGETTTNNTITALRALSLSKQGRMVDEVFSISGLNSSRGLLPDSTPSALIYHSPGVVYAHLQAVPVNITGNVRDFLSKAIDIKMQRLQAPTATQADSLGVQPLMDYYLCALLLDKDLSAFAAELPRFYGPNQVLPPRYAEALAMCRHDSTEIDSIYHQYTVLREGTPAPHTRKACAERFPNTYWNYYYFK